MTNTASAIALDGTKTRKFQSTRTGRMETWNATSADGKWTFERIEEPGTPWLVRHADHGPWYATFSSLPKARKSAEAELAFDLARNPWKFVARSGRVA